MEPSTVVLVPHTHWDREWYLPFEGFLERLVPMMDGLIALMDREPRFAHFHLDGQVAMIDDYLAVRPEREPDLRRLAGDGRISVGPWYTQMDEFLVSGESLIRNLEWGLARARELGGEPKAGYLPDQFGHVGQMPQILRRSGIERAVAWRGVPAAIDRTAFWWEAPDGSRVLTEYLAFGYGMGAALGQARTAQELATGLRKAVELLRSYSPRDRLLVPVGADHFAPAARLPGFLESVNGAAHDGFKAEMGSIDGYLEGADPEGIPTWRGELRSSARAHLLPGVYSTRVHQKRERARVEALIERYAEPLAALVPGFRWPESELREAWRQLLWNGAHDSVCGCSVDEVARAVDERFARARAIGHGVVSRALTALGCGVRSRGTLRFNPSPFEREGVPGLGWRVEPGPARNGSPPNGDELRIEVGEDGRLAVDGIRFWLLDEADVGDLYNFCPPEGGVPAPAESVTATDGGAEVRFPGVTVTLRAHRRSEEPFTRLDGVIVNERPDHRLRLHVGLAAPAAGSLAASPFELVERPIRSEGGTELPSATWPARGAALAADTAVVAEGVFEYEVTEDPPALVITLLRCVGTISRPHLATRPWPAGPDIATPAAQMIGETAFSVGLFPRATAGALVEAWERFALPLVSAPSSGGGELPEAGSFLAIEGAEVSSIRRRDGGLEVRVWNAASEPRRAAVGGAPIELGPARIADVRL